MTTLPPKVQSLDALHDLLERGLFTEAYESASSLGPLEDWRGGRARVLAGRLFRKVGWPRLGDAHYLRSFRDAPESLEACIYSTFALSRIGWIYEALDRLSLEREWSDDCPRLRALRHEARASILTTVRDLDAVERELKEAKAIRPDPWQAVIEANALERQDKLPQALEVIESVCGEPRDGRVMVVQVRAHLLTQLNRVDEALEVLGEGAERTQSIELPAHKMTLEIELQRFEDAWASLELARERCLRPEPAYTKWMKGCEAEILRRLGRIREAAEAAEKAEKSYYGEVAKNLRKATPNSRRVQLDVEFVRQDELTCVPATMTALGNFFGAPVEQSEIAGEICYEGTEDSAERAWAEERGWTVREFRVTYASTRALIDRGVPFAVTTRSTMHAHMQAIIGYDEAKETLIIREPGSRYTRDWLAEKALQTFAPCGPRGLIFLPKDKAHLAEGIELPEEAQYELLFKVHTALRLHKREEAEEPMRRLREEFPGEATTLQAEQRLAGYDGAHLRVLRASESLLKLHPDEGMWLLSRYRALLALGRSGEALEGLREATRKKDADFAVRRALADELLKDGRKTPDAVRVSRVLVRTAPGDGDNHGYLASSLWSACDFPRATLAYRYASMLQPRNEARAFSYFKAARHVKTEEEVLGYLRRRVELYGAYSTGPALTLRLALRSLLRFHESEDLLERLLRENPDDPDVLLAAVREFSRPSTLDRARECLVRAKGRVHRRAWLEAAANLDATEGRPEASLERWNEILRNQPEDIGAIQRVAQLTSQTQSRKAAADFLAEKAREQPHNYALRAELIIWLRTAESPDYLPTLNDFAAKNPGDPWMLREYAIHYTDEKRFDEAVAKAREAFLLEPCSNNARLLGNIHEKQGKRAEAVEQFRKAVELNIDESPAINNLMSLSRDVSEKRKWLEFVERQIEIQANFGDGVWAYGQHATTLLPVGDYERRLRKLIHERADLFEPKSLLIQLLLRRNRLDAAEKLARACVKDYPVIGRCHYDLADVLRARGDLPGVVAALEVALEVSPGYVGAAHALLDAYTKAGEQEKARRLAENLVREYPYDQTYHGSLAQLLQSTGDSEQAKACLRRALEIGPSYTFAVNQLCLLAQQEGQEKELIEWFREKAQKPHAPSVAFENLAVVLARFQLNAEALEAVEKGLDLEPADLDLLDSRAMLLTRVGRAEEALELCRREGRDYGRRVRLKFREGIIHMMRGQIDEAISTLEAYLEEDPLNAEAWERLHHCYTDKEDAAKMLETAEKLVELNPQNAYAHGCVADAHLHAGESAGNLAAAKPFLMRALELDPAYAFAARNLARIQIKECAWDAAERTVATAETACGPSLGAFLRLRLVLNRDPRDHAAIIDALSKLAKSEDDGSLIRDAINETVKTIPPKKLLKSLAPLIWEADTNAELGKAWTYLGLNNGMRLRVQLRINFKPINTPAAVEAHVTFVEYHTQMQGANLGELNLQVRWKRRRYLANDFLWGAVGYAYASLSEFRQAAKWLRDWRTRQNAQPWMVSNRILALLSTGAPKQAGQDAADALQLMPDHTYPQIFIYHCLLNDLPPDRLQAALDQTSAFRDDEISNFVRFARDLATLLLRVQLAPEPERVQRAREGMQEAKEVLNTHRDRLNTRSRGHLYLPAMKRLAKLANKPAGYHCWTRLKWTATKLFKR